MSEEKQKEIKTFESREERGKNRYVVCKTRELVDEVVERCV